jgi:hypothetical protein
MNMMWDMPYISEEERQIIIGPRIPSNYDLFDAWKISKKNVISRDYAIFGHILTEKHL